MWVDFFWGFFGSRFFSWTEIMSLRWNNTENGDCCEEGTFMIVWKKDREFTIRSVAWLIDWKSLASAFLQRFRIGCVIYGVEHSCCRLIDWLLGLIIQLVRSIDWLISVDLIHWLRGLIDWLIDRLIDWLTLRLHSEFFSDWKFTSSHRSSAVINFPTIDMNL